MQVYFASVLTLKISKPTYTTSTDLSGSTSVRLVSIYGPFSGKRRRRERSCQRSRKVTSSRRSFQSTKFETNLL